MVINIIELGSLLNLLSFETLNVKVTSGNSDFYQVINAAP